MYNDDSYYNLDVDDSENYDYVDNNSKYDYYPGPVILGVNQYNNNPLPQQHQ